MSHEEWITNNSPDTFIIWCPKTCDALYGPDHCFFVAASGEAISKSGETCPLSEKLVRLDAGATEMNTEVILRLPAPLSSSTPEISAFGKMVETFQGATSLGGSDVAAIGALVGRVA